MIEPFISIIVPVYNIKPYLPKCVESLLSQTFHHFEVILVDDGSTDGSGWLCDTFASNDARIRVIHKPNGGLSSARNYGLDASRGDYMLFVDGDDYLAHDALQSLMDVAEKHDGFDFIGFHYIETDGSWQSGGKQNSEICVCTDVRDMFCYLYQHGGVAASSCTKLYAADIFRNLRFKEGISNEDEQLINELLPKCRKVIYTNLVLYGYVMRGGSIIHSGFNRHRLDIIGIMDERVSVLKKAGCEEFILPTQRGQFITCSELYCKAKKSNDKESCKILRAKLGELSRIQGLSPGRQYTIIYHLIKFVPNAPDFYYIARRIFKKTI